MKIEIFDPPMCCSSGLCGPSVDQNLVQIQENLEKLKQEFSGLELARYQLTQQPAKFKENEEVFKAIKAKGKSVLPITTVNGKVLKLGAYPSLDELRSTLRGETVE